MYSHSFVRTSGASIHKVISKLIDHKSQFRAITLSTLYILYMPSDLQGQHSLCECPPDQGASRHLDGLTPC